MKILILANKFPYPPKDGGSIATLNLALGLQQAGNEVTLLAINTSKHYFNRNNLPEELIKKIDFYDHYLNTDIHLLDLFRNLFFSNLPYNAERFISTSFEEKIKEILQKKQFDIIQLEGLYLLPYIKFIRKHSAAKIAYRAHNIEFEIWERVVANETNILKKIYARILVNRLKSFEKSFINTYDSLLSITQRDLNKLKELGNTKSSQVIPTGINMEEYEISEKYEFPSLFFLGALDWIPNQEGLNWFLKNCWFKLLLKNPKLKLNLAGRNAPTDFIKKLPKKNIEFLGEVDDAKEFMNNNAIMMVPLLSGSGMRIKIIEGMALGKVIVSTSVGAEGINVVHQENIIIADTPDDFIESIHQIVTNKEMFEKISFNARAFISKHYDNFAIAKKLSDFYHEIIKK